jgi:thiamine biosynthesis lipoprotein
VTHHIIRTEALMGTFVTIDVVEGDNAGVRDRLIEDAFGWFREVESRCSRFDATSELCRLGATVGEPVAVSRLLFSALQFACGVAAETGGACDPTIGGTMAARGFDTHYATGERIMSASGSDGVSYSDIHLDADRRTITLSRPLTLDLGAIAKGLAVDLAATALAPLRHFAIDAGGDLYLSGHSGEGHPWRIGIRHPRHEGAIADQLELSDRAVCTSGDYERLDATGEPHVLDPRTGQPARGLASVTVIADSALCADAFSTAAFVLGPVEGLAFLERVGVDGLLVTSTMERFATPGMSRVLFSHA